MDPPVSIPWKLGDRRVESQRAVGSPVGILKTLEDRRVGSLGAVNLPVGTLSTLLDPRAEGHWAEGHWAEGHSAESHWAADPPASFRTLEAGRVKSQWAVDSPAEETLAGSRTASGPEAKWSQAWALCASSSGE